MSKRATVIDKAIADLEAKRLAIREKAKADLDGIEVAIEVLRKQDTRRIRKPRSLSEPATVDRKTQAAGA